MRRSAAAGLVLLVLAGCSDPAQPTGNDRTAEPAETGTTPSAVPSPAPTTAAPSASESPEPSASSPTHQVPATVIFTRVPKGKTKAHRQALTAYQKFFPAYMKTLSTLEMDPAIFALAPELVQPIRKEIRSDKRKDSHYAGETRVEITDVSGDRSEVVIEACLDVRKSVVVTQGKAEPEPKPYVDSVITLNYVMTEFSRGLAVHSMTEGKNIC